MNPGMTTTPNIKESSRGKMPWYKKTAFTSLFWPFVIGVTLIIVTIILTRMAHLK
jgi:hypothetical protein